MKAIPDHPGAPPEKLDSEHDLERVRAEWQPVMGRDALFWVVWYAFWKVFLKIFSLSFLFACLATSMLYDMISAKETNSLASWYPWAFVTTFWLNLLARPQFKRLAEAFAKMLEGKGKAV